jgi:hypothetical protein
MRAEIFGAISGVLVFVSAIPYLWSMFRGKTEQHPVSWTLWSIIGLSLLVTYQGSGASFWSLVPVFQAFINPVLVLCFILFKKWRNREKVAMRLSWKALTWDEKTCLILGLAALGVWVLVQGNKELAQWALYLSLVADVFAALPTILMVWRNPSADKPGAWGIFAIGYVFALPVITKPSFANYALPIYMIGIYGTIAVITGIHERGLYTDGINSETGT